MDAKLTPEQAIERIRVWGRVYLINMDEANQIADIFESLAADAELGRVAVEAINNDDEAFGLCKGKFVENKDGACYIDCECVWSRFCRLRAGKDGK